MLVKKSPSKLVSLAMLGVGGMLMSVAASATPTGSLDINSSTGDVSVGLTSVTFLPNSGPPNGGPIQVTGGTTLTYDGGTPLAVGTTGHIQNFSNSTTLPLSAFMTFTSTPLNFSLGSLGLGSTNTTCTDVVGVSCSLYVGAPFILTATSTGSFIGLAANGTVTDGMGTANWTGNFSTTITGMGPKEIQAYFAANPNGALTSPYSGTFNLNVTPVPEPSSALLVGAALVGIGTIAKRRVRR